MPLPALPLPFTVLPSPSATHHHCVIPYASVGDDSCQHVLQTLELPHLEQLLRTLAPSDVDLGEPDQPIPPHERAVARAWGLDAAQPAWAACTTDLTEPCAWFTPCHWTAGADQVRMDDPSALVLDAEDAQALHRVLQPWFAEDGMQLTIVEPQRWCVSGAPVAQLMTASMDRVLLRDVSNWLPPTAAARRLQRLHSEVQMLLYDHGFNDARAERGLSPINAFWMHGAGQLSADALTQVRTQQAQVHLQVIDSLRQSALRQDWVAWKAAWLAADAGPLTDLLHHVHAGGQATLTLAGELHARSFSTQPRSWTDKIRNLFSPQRFAGLHQAL